MKFSPRLLILLFIVLVFIFVGLLKWQSIFTEILHPVSLVIWLLLRIFILSIGQQYYWWALILAVLVLAVRLIPREETIAEKIETNQLNETINAVKHWRSLYIPNESNAYGRFLERDFLRMLVTMYAAKLRMAPDFKLYDALRQGQIFIPEHIRKSLYSELPRKENWSLHRMIKTIRDWPVKVWRRSSGRDIEEHYRMIEDVLDFFESSLEMKHDN